MSDTPASPPAPVPSPDAKSWVVSPEGGIGTVPTSQVDRALKEGFRPASVEETNKASSDAEAAEHPVSAFALGALGVVPGAKSAIAGLSGDARLGAQGVTRIEEANPKASLAGAMAGMAGGALVGAPTSLAGAAALGAGLAGAGSAESSALQQYGDTGLVDIKQVAKAGGIGALAGGVTGGVLGAAGGRILPKLAARSPFVAGLGTVAAGTAGGAIGGGIFAGAEDLLGDHALTAEQYLSSMGKGALLGFAGSAHAGLGVAKAVKAGRVLAANDALKDVGASKSALNEAMPGLAEATSRVAESQATVDGLSEKHGVPVDDINAAVAQAHAAAAEQMAANPPSSLAEERSVADGFAEKALKFLAGGDAAKEKAYLAAHRHGLADISTQATESDAMVRDHAADVRELLTAGKALDEADRVGRQDALLRELAAGDNAKYQEARRTADELRRRSEGAPLDQLAAGEHDRIAGDLGKSVESFIKAREATQEAIFGDAKADEMAALVPKENVRQATQQVLSIATDVEKLLDFWETVPNQGGVGGPLKRLRGVLNDFIEPVGTGRAIGEIALRKNKELSARDLFMRTDAVRRELGRAAQFGREQFLKPEAIRDVEGLFYRVRDALQDPSVWGPAAEAQTAINAPTSRLIGLGDMFTKTFVRRYGVEGGDPVFVPDLAALKRLAADPRGVENQTTLRAVSDFLREQGAQWDAAEKHYKLNEKTRAAIAEGRKQSEAFGRTLKDAVTRAETLDVLKAAEREPLPSVEKREAFQRNFATPVAGGHEPDAAAIRSFQDNILKPEADTRRKVWSDYVSDLRLRVGDAKSRGAAGIGRASEVLRGIDAKMSATEARAQKLAMIRKIHEEEAHRAVPGSLGIPAMVVLDPFTRPITTIGRVGRMLETKKAVTARIRAAARGVVGVETKAAPGPSKAHPPDVPTMTEAETIKAAETMREMSPEEMQARAQKQVGDMHLYAPKVATLIAMNSVKTLGYLKATAPVPRSSGTALQPLVDKRRYAKADLDDYGERFTTAHDPVAKLEGMMRGGRISRAAVETLEATQEQLMAQMKREVTAALTDKKDPIAWKAAKSLTALFGEPANAALEPSFVTAMQATTTPASGSPKGGAAAGAPHQALSALKTDGSQLNTPSQQVASAR